MSIELPQYRCHKVVRAAKIQNITAPPRGKTGAIIDLEAQFGRVLSFRSMHVNGDWLAKHQPKVGGYYVVYEDGYTSWSPAEAFEAGYALVTAPNLQPIARLCHEVNRALCEAFGDHSQESWERADQWQRDSAMSGVEYAINHPDAGPEAQHEAWMTEKLKLGWTYGPVKDPVMKKHPCIVPYSELPPQQKAKDHTFRAIVKAMLP